MNETLVFTMEQFTENADVIHEEIERQKMVSLLTTVNKIRLRMARDMVESDEHGIGKTTIKNMLHSASRESLKTEISVTESKTSVSLSWGETMTTPPPTDEGWFALIPSAQAWWFSMNPPRVILPRYLAFSLN